MSLWMARFLSIVALLWLACLASPPARAQNLLPGEFGDIDLGRELVDADRLPTIRELRTMVANPRMQHVLMLKLYGDQHNHTLPVWSEDGRRLAFQRADVSRDVSKLLLFEELSQETPKLLTTDDNAYDYAFRWAVNGEDAYTFTRLDARSRTSSIYVSISGQPPETRTAQAGKYFAPSLLARTDGIWRLAYEKDGTIAHEAWTAEQTVYDPLNLIAGTSPRWSRDGFRILAARGLPGRSNLGTQEIVIRGLADDEEIVIPSAVGEMVRSPAWSPDESFVAYYARRGGNEAPWTVRACAVSGTPEPISLASDVMVNADFNSQGPSWEPSGRRVWFFSNQHRQQAYYPLAAASVDGGSVITVDYPRRCTSPNDLAANPSTRIPEFAFVGHQGLSQDVYVVLLNHY
ncbi:MAG: PD40 domain-containing protein [Planctomycetales bacterium]|nr:PD40 domain-containing protein [Planctomycetales bacterium]